MSNIALLFRVNDKCTFYQTLKTGINNDEYPPTHRCVLNIDNQLQWRQAYVVISPDMKNNERLSLTRVFFLKPFIGDLFALFTSLKQLIHLKWLLNILYQVSRSYLVMSSHIKHLILLFSNLTQALLTWHVFPLPSTRVLYHSQLDKVELQDTVVSLSPDLVQPV